MLENHADARGPGLSRAADCYRVAFPENAARTGIKHAEQHFYQRRLARAIFPQQCMDFARSNGEIDAVAGTEASKNLGQPPCFQKRRFGSLVIHVTP
jgi:hypothetical protein